jgi:acetyl-CoA carboxylase carboxyl transferase subunit alpha
VGNIPSSVQRTALIFKAMVFLDFEKPLESLFEQLEKIKQVGEEGDLDVTPMIDELEHKIKAKRKEIYDNLTPWQKVQLSRHPERPYTLYYIEQICQKFIELHGDRCFGDDKAIVGGLATIDDHTVMVIGQQKGSNTKTRQYRNFGMANPEGYRKALRLMKLAERFGFPVLTFIDTPGAFPGIEAEERGQAEAIARNLFEMARLEVPIVCIIIGEGASGGAIGIGLGDEVYMLENTWYSVISPESCSSILWRSWDFKEQAAEALKLTAENMLSFGLIDGIIKEPLGGAHTSPEEMAAILKDHILKALSKLEKLTPDELIDARISKYSSMGVYDVLPVAVEAAEEKAEA